MTNTHITHQPQSFGPAVHLDADTTRQHDVGPARARVRSAIFVDFDNVFGGLWSNDSAAALRFASAPQDWLERLAVLPAGEQRDFRIRRVYLNPQGSLASARGDGGRPWFHRFRPALTAAGFEVVDCPPLTGAQKNAADIRIVLDVMDVAAQAPIDEIVIASSDSDFTPLMYRLRASDRRTLILTTNPAPAAFRNTADAVIDNGAMIALVTGRSTGGGADLAPFEVSADCATIVPTEVDANNNKPSTEVTVDRDTARAAAADSDRVRAWKGRFPAEITALCRTADLPKIATECWPTMLAEIAAASAEFGTYSPAEMSRTVRDRLVQHGVVIGRTAVSAVYHSLAKAGIDTETSEGHTVESYVDALVAHYCERAGAFGWILDGNQREILRAWLAGEGANHRPAEGSGSKEDTFIAAESTDSGAEAA